MVDLIAVLDSTKDCNGVLYGRFCGINRLETTLKGLVLLDVLSVLIKCGCTDCVQLSPCQGRLDQVGGIGGALCRTCTDNGVKLIYEEDYRALAAGYLIDDGLQTLLELSTELGSCNQGTDVQGEKLLVLKGIRDIAADDSLCKTLDYCGLSDTRLSDENRVVLGLPGQDLHDTPDLLVTADDRIHLPLPCGTRHVTAVLLKSLILALCILVRHPLASTYALQSLHDCITGYSIALEKTADLSVIVQKGKDHVLCADIFVLELVSLRL